MDAPPDLLSLDPASLAIVEALAVADDSLTLTALTLILIKQGIPLDGRAANTHSIVPVLDRLQARRIAGSSKYDARITLDPNLAEPLVRSLRDEGRYETVVKVVAQIVPLDHTAYAGRPQTLWRELRRALYARDRESFERLRAHPWARDAPSLLWLLDPLDADLIRNQPPEVGAYLLEQISLCGFAYRRAVPGLRELADELAPRGRPFERVAMRERLLAGEVARPAEGERDAIAAWAWFALGDVRRSAATYAAALASERALTKTTRALLLGPEGAMLPLVYALEGSPLRSKQAQAQIKLVQRERLASREGSYWRGWLHLRRLFDPTMAPVDTGSHPFAVLLAGLVARWTERPIDSDAIAQARAAAAACGWTWMERELASLVGEVTPIPGTVPIVRHRQTHPEWEQRLALLEVAAGVRTKHAETRIAWELTRIEPLDLIAREQKWVRGGWTRGNPVGRTRLLGKTKNPLALTDADRRIVAALDPETWRYRFDAWNEVAAWPALAEHPLVIDEHGRPLTIVLKKPELAIEESEGRLRLAARPAIDASTVHVQQVGDHGLEVTVFSPRQRELAKLFADIDAPVDARERIASVLDRLGGDFDVRDELEAPREVAGDPTPVLLLRPHGTGVSIQAAVHPIGAAGPSFTPGEGPAVALARHEGQPVRVRRDLDAELVAISEVEAEAPVLERASWVGAQQMLAAPDEALELVLQLRALGDRVRVLWPEGEAFRIRSAAQPKGLKVAVKTARDWFQLSGELRADDGLVLDLADAIARLEGGRFVRLDDGSFLALTDRLKEMLAAVGRVVNDGMEVHRLASDVLTTLVAEAGKKKTDEGWALHQEALDDPGPDPAVPVGLATELRPYQVEGFHWMARLARFGAGACLADDMGLGKTIMALALLLHRASDGPALVIAPTSVSGNWMREAWRFAPGLRVIDFREADRAATIEAVGPGDLVLASYGIVATQTHGLERVAWSTLIVDEAQAIKNAETLRHKAVREIRARFRMALTGTPVENRVGELWSHFSILNPGMLGSEKQFRSRFARAIESGDRVVQRELQRLVAPYVLRRTKATVLADLPARTEIDVLVDPGVEEASLYEALRRRALASVGGEKSHVRILAEITRLRLCACHPRLVLPDTDATSAKLEAFGEIVSGLAANQHRALVFSQFVKHLAVLRAWLDERGISYAYLDGETPARERTARVQDFQSGDKTLFLISLRAGGFGLNLTAADYVIHMDPWWNPAVEDQASDRAHRLGQTRPVTIYRLIARGTIEERIVELHRTKRDLADRVLSGTDATGGLSAQELVALIREGAAGDG